MSRLMYNGLVLDSVKLLSYRKDAMYAGNQFLGLRHTISVHGVFNPALNSYRPGNPIGNTPTSQGGFIAPVTEASIRHQLMIPRKLLGVAIGTVFMTVCPSAQNLNAVISAAILTGTAAALTGGLAAAAATVPQFLPLPARVDYTDAADGPIPISAEVEEVVGYKTFLVNFQIQCFLNETPPRRGRTYPQSPLLAHEWSMVHDIDQDCHLTRTIEGRAVFRSDVLRRYGLIPDQLRWWLGHPIPEFMARIRVKVRALSDNRTLEYQIVDRERRLNFDPNIVTRVEATWEEDLHVYGLETMVMKIGRFMSDIGKMGAAGWFVNLVGGVGLIGAGLPAILRGLVQTGTIERPPGLWGQVLSGIPVTDYHFTVRVWGHPRSDPQDLQEFCRGWIQARFNELRVGPFAVGAGAFQLGNARWRILHDDAGKFVEMQASAFGSVLQSIANLFRPPMPRNAGGDVAQAPLTPQAIAVDWMRGSHLSACVARALRDPSDVWDQPQDPPTIDDRDSLRNLNQSSNPTLQDIQQP